jgi:hypothetical protein
MVLWNEGLLVVRLPVLAGSNLALLLSAQDGKQQGLPCSVNIGYVNMKIFIHCRALYGRSNEIKQKKCFHSRGILFP